MGSVGGYCTNGVGGIDYFQMEFRLDPVDHEKFIPHLHFHNSPSVVIEMEHTPMHHSECGPDDNTIERYNRPMYIPHTRNGRRTFEGNFLVETAYCVDGGPDANSFMQRYPWLALHFHLNVDGWAYFHRARLLRDGGGFEQVCFPIAVGDEVDVAMTNDKSHATQCAFGLGSRNWVVGEAMEGDMICGCSGPDTMSD